MSSPSQMAAALILFGSLVVSTSASASAGKSHLRRLRFFNPGSAVDDASSLFEESPLIEEAFGKMQDFAETERFFRRLGGSMSMSMSMGMGMGMGVTGDDRPPAPKPPTAKPPAPKPPTAKPPTAKPPTAKPPTAKPPVPKPPTPMDPAPAPTPTSVVERPTNPAPVPTSGQVKASIYEIAAGTDEFSTLTAAIDAAGLDEALSGPGTFTVFAPPNSAFEKLPDGAIERLLEDDWKFHLQDILLYHALGSEVRSSDLKDDSTAETLNGEDILINLDPPRINEESEILVDAGLVDIEASNGVIHGVDDVLLPTSATSSIVDIAAGNDDFSTLVAAVVAADLVDKLSGPGPLTVFAPTNEAFAALPDGLVESLLKPENKDQLVAILTYHVVAANAHSSTLSDGDVPTLNGDSVTISNKKKGLKVNDANVVAADILANNGIIHAIDEVLLPPQYDTKAPVAAPVEDPVPAPTDAPVDAPTEREIPDEPTFDAPTASPTKAPVPALTLAPIPVPTEPPVVAPTASPTAEPTESPTTPPTASPTDEPTESPTTPPTASPTDEPTVSPTKAPVPALTLAPIPVPTEPPVVAPTEPEATPKPTESPTTPPTASPTDEPTESPTTPPTASPTDEPTESPTTPPTASPTDEPTESPTTPPTASPTDEPTVSPTKAPVTTPTEPPVIDPTEAPVPAPTEAPVVAPTEAPVVAPTEAPVPAPTEAPVVAPTEAPVPAPTEPSVPAPVPTRPDTPAPTSAPTPNCNLSPEERTQQITEVLSGVSPVAVLEDPSTPQGQAYQYIVTDDEAQVCPDDDSLIQRYVAATLYYSTEGDSWTECSQDDASCGRDGPFGGKDAFLSAGSECNWAGLSCNRNGELERIELAENNLGGEIPSELSALPLVDTIELEENRITGTMPSEICQNVEPLGPITSLITDCGGSEPLVQCECCTRCFRQ